MTAGGNREPRDRVAMPAERIATSLEWADLVLAPEVRDQVEMIVAAVVHEAEILDDWGFRRLVRPGHRALFHGPPGVGKTLTATLIGKSLARDVYRVDLSIVVSKYIGETEKNLARVFRRAEQKGWVLYFDEADALFGRRSEVKDAHDRYANQETAYLLQRMEAFQGLAILATSLKGAIDPAFVRRFQSVVQFPVPGPKQRLQLWRGILRPPVRLADDVDLADLARACELTGGVIVDAARAAAVRAKHAGRDAIGRDDLLMAVRDELRKDGATP